jgi:hypothetical protein
MLKHPPSLFFDLDEQELEAVLADVSVESCRTVLGIGMDIDCY